jgi:2-oxoglutarate ferredoxin oxidoreductase subunit alpha
MSNKAVLLQGNQACVMGAIRAGMRFFGGYPITPSSEIAEQSSILLPQVGGKFIQMEDEIASIASVIGASLTGTKSMTASSGPGISLKQELVGYAAMAEIPIVIASIMRAGPSTGLPTSPASGDVMQAKWGTHGDHPVIAVCPTSVREMYELTITAFNYAEKYRTPVYLITDEVIAHMREGVELKGEYEIIDRTKPSEPPSPNYLPYGCVGDSKIPPMAAYGEGYRFHMTGLSHNETGFPTNSPAVNEALIRRLYSKVEDDADSIAINELFMTEDAEVLLVAYGSVARASLFVAKQLREQGIKAGLFVPKVLWPFPEKALRAAVSGNVRQVIVPEMNLGQYVLEVERVVGCQAPVSGISKVSGELFKAEELYENVMAVMNK